MAAAIATALERADPAHASTYMLGCAGSTPASRRSTGSSRKLRGAFAGQPVAYTEPVPGYLINAAGLTKFVHRRRSRAPSRMASSRRLQAVADMDAARHGLMRSKVLLYNTRADTDHQRVRPRRNMPASRSSRCETMPPHRNFQQWQLGQAERCSRLFRMSGTGRRSYRPKAWGFASANACSGTT